MGKDKLKRFAEIETFDNVIQPTMDEVLDGFSLKGNWNKDHFKKEQPIVLELGCGKGEYTVGMAKMFPEKNFMELTLKALECGRAQKFRERKTSTTLLFLDLK